MVAVFQEFLGAISSFKKEIAEMRHYEVSDVIKRSRTGPSQRRARKTRGSPNADLLQEQILINRNRCASLPRTPAPEHDRSVHMLVDGSRIPATVALRVHQQSAQLTVR